MKTKPYNKCSQRTRKLAAAASVRQIVWKCIMVMKRWFLKLAIGLVLITSVCHVSSADPKSEHIVIAERYFRGVYTSDLSVVDDLVAEDITVSYPIFESLFGSPTLQGREAVRSLVTWFEQRWADTQIEFIETVSEGDRVVLMWSLRARYIVPLERDQQAINPEHIWSGISLFRFDNAGKIVEEIGYESKPRTTQIEK